MLALSPYNVCLLCRSIVVRGYVERALIQCWVSVKLNAFTPCSCKGDVDDAVLVLELVQPGGQERALRPGEDDANTLPLTSFRLEDGHAGNNRILDKSRRETLDLCDPFSLCGRTKATRPSDTEIPDRISEFIERVSRCSPRAQPGDYRLQDSILLGQEPLTIKSEPGDRCLSPERRHSETPTRHDIQQQIECGISRILDRAERQGKDVVSGGPQRSPGARKRHVDLLTRPTGQTHGLAVSERPCQLRHLIANRRRGRG